MEWRKAGELLAAAALGAGGTTLAAEGLRDVASGGEEQSALGNAVVTALALAGGAGGGYMRHRGSGAGIKAKVMDNPLTRGWSNTISGGLAPLDRRLANDAQLANAIPLRVGDMTAVEGPYTAEQVAVMNALKGSDINPEAVQNANKTLVPLKNASERRADVNEMLNALLDTFMPNRERLIAAAEALPAPHNMISDMGVHARNTIGSAPAAYGAVAGGAALALKGAYDVVARMQAGEPVSEEEAVAADRVLKEAKTETGVVGQ